MAIRTIEFRGLRIDGEGWIYGDLYHGLNGEVYINHVVQLDPTSRANKLTMVEWESVGQFTGLYDKNGVKVFEGDTVVTDCVLVFGEPVDGFAGVVKYLECCFYIDSGTDALKVWSDAYQVEVTGNIHEPATVRE